MERIHSGCGLRDWLPNKKVSSLKFNDLLVSWVVVISIDNSHRFQDSSTHTKIRPARRYFQNQLMIYHGRSNMLPWFITAVSSSDTRLRCCLTIKGHRELRFLNCLFSSFHVCYQEEVLVRFVSGKDGSVLHTQASGRAVHGLSARTQSLGETSEGRAVLRIAWVNDILV